MRVPTPQRFRYSLRSNIKQFSKKSRPRSGDPPGLGFETCHSHAWDDSTATRAQATRTISKFRLRGPRAARRTSF